MLPSVLAEVITPGVKWDRFDERYRSASVLAWVLNNPTRPLRSPADLINHTLLHDETPYEGRPDWVTWLNAVGATSIDGSRGLRFNRVSLALAAAVQAQGVVLSLEQLASDDLENGRLVIPFKYKVELSQAYHVITLQNTADDERVKSFKQWLFDEVAADANSNDSITDRTGSL